MNNHFKERLIRIQDKFNLSFGMNPLINPEIRRSAVWAVIKLGLLQRKIAMAPTSENIQEFVKIQAILEKTFARVEKLSTSKTGRLEQAQASRIKQSQEPKAVPSFGFPFTGEGKPSLGGRYNEGVKNWNLRK